MPAPHDRVTESTVSVAMGMSRVRRVYGPTDPDGRPLDAYYVGRGFLRRGVDIPAAVWHYLDATKATGWLIVPDDDAQPAAHSWIDLKTRLLSGALVSSVSRYVLRDRKE